MQALLAFNIVVWAAVIAYSLRLVPAFRRAWRGWAAGIAVLLAAAVSVVSYQSAARQQVRRQAQQHYYAGIDEKQRGNLEEAEKEFKRALELQPGDPAAQQQLQELKPPQPAEKREQQKQAAVDPNAAPPPPSTSPPPSPSTPSTSPPSPAPPKPAEKPAPKPETPGKGRPGEKPKPAPHKPSPFEILHYALDVELVPAAHTLSATATIRVRSRGEAVPVLDFSLNKEFQPVAVQVNGVTAGFRHTNDLLALTPAKPLPPKAEATVTVRYKREGSPLVEGGDLIAEQGTYLRSEARWYPATGELDFRSPVRVRARVPKGFSVVSVGGLKGIEKDAKGTVFTWETERLASMVSLAAAKYEQQSVTIPPPAGTSRPPLKVTCYTFPKHRNRAPLFLKEAAAAVRFYEGLIGPYPYEKLGVVEIPLFPGGYGTTSFVMLIDKSFEEKKIDREFLAHEIAHQWWGNSVFPQGLGAAWLTEAFSNYCAWMFDAARAGNPRLLTRRVAKATGEYFQLATVKGDQPIAETDPYQQLGASEQIIYEKGAVVLHMLRQEVGDATFRRILRRFAETYRMGKATIADFRQLAETEAGQPMDGFFDQWLGRTGGLALTYSFETIPDTPTQNVAVLHVTQEGQPYRARLKVVLDVEGLVQNHTIELTEAQQTFRFPVKGKVTSVLFDPDNVYLMRPPRWIVPETKP